MSRLVDAAKSGDRYETLCSMRDILASTIEEANSNGDTSHISAMVKQMSELTNEIATLEKQMKKKSRRSSIDKARQAARNG